MVLTMLSLWSQSASALVEQYIGRCPAVIIHGRSFLDWTACKPQSQITLQAMVSNITLPLNLPPTNYTDILLTLYHPPQRNRPQLKR